MEDKYNNNLCVKIPKSPFSKKYYNDFMKVCQVYLDILNNIYANFLNNKKRVFYNDEDILVITDLLYEIINYSNNLLHKNLINESGFLIKIGIELSNSFYEIFSLYSNGLRFLKHPLSLKLLLLQSYFNLHFKYLKNYILANEILIEIINIQKFLEFSEFYVASSYFYLTIINFFIKNFEKAEITGEYAKNLLYKKINMKAFSENDDLNNKNSKIKIKNIKDFGKLTDIMNILGEIYLFKKDFNKVLKCYENAYFINLKLGEKYKTQYFKEKLYKISGKMKYYLPKEIEDINENLNSYKNNDNEKFKGKTETFAFRLLYTSLYQPLIISIYYLDKKNMNDLYEPKYFIKNLYFNKNKIITFLKIKEANNKVFYNIKNIVKILNAIKCENKKIIFINKNLKNCLVGA